MHMSAACCYYEEMEAEVVMITLKNYTVTEAARYVATETFLKDGFTVPALLIR